MILYIGLLLVLFLYSSIIMFAHLYVIAVILIYHSDCIACSGYFTLNVYVWGIFHAYIRLRLLSRLRFHVFWEAERDNTSTINLSFNKLEGQVPNTGALLNLSIVTLVGNAPLCGEPRQGFPPCLTNARVSKSWTSVLLKRILPAAVFIIILVACC